LTALLTFELTVALTAPALIVGFDRACRLTARLIAASSPTATTAPAAIQYLRPHHRLAQVAGGRTSPAGWALDPSARAG
jgi:hypothetical protein